MNCNRRLRIAGLAAGASGHSSRAIGGDKGMKRCTRPIYWLWAALVLGALAASPCAAAWTVGDDFDPASPPAGMNWDDWTPNVDYYYVDYVTEYVQKQPGRGLTCVRALMSAHVSTKLPRTLSHNHYEFDFDERDNDTTYMPDVADANVYSSARNGTTRFSDATNAYNCHTYAFDQVAGSGGGNYNYWMSHPHYAYTDEMEELDPESDVDAYDVLRYDGAGTEIAHTTIVTTVVDQLPAVLKYAMGSGGVFMYCPTTGHEKDTPKCDGPVYLSTKICDQWWWWDVDKYDDGTLYTLK